MYISDIEYQRIMKALEKSEELQREVRILLRELRNKILGSHPRDAEKHCNEMVESCKRLVK